LRLRVWATLRWPHNLAMNTLILLNSSSPGYAEGRELILSHLDHLGVPCTIVDLMHTPLPADVAEYVLIVVAHSQLDPLNRRLGKAGRRALLEGVRAGCGLMSFDPTLPSATEIGVDSTAKARAGQAETVAFVPREHYITARHTPGENLPLVTPLSVPAMAASSDGVLLTAGGATLLSATTCGRGRVVRWATSQWLRTTILGPLAGLDDVLWRGVVWAARKPFALRGLPPLVAMRVDDVAGWGELWGRSPLYWVHTVNQHSLRPWLGLFIYNLTEPAIDELRDLIERDQATAFPHAFGRPPRTADSNLYYCENALPLRADDYDEFIYFDHGRGRPWSDAEATRGLAAVDEWYAAHAPLPMSSHAIAHWGEIGSNTITHARDCWRCDLISVYHDLNVPLDGASWLVAGPFRRYETPGSALFDADEGGQRPVYYADFVNFAGHRFFNCVTEIRDDAGYEWAPDNNVAATVERGVRQLRRALDSMALAVLFTHETDYIYKIHPVTWAEEIAQVTAGIAEYDPIYTTLDEAVRYVRATWTSRLESCRYDATTGKVTAAFTGCADVPTHFHLFTETDGEIRTTLVDVPAFEDEITIVQLYQGRK
jgi:hypothetical protein